MPRLSRSESQARTREQLVATAKELFLRDGYGPTSLDKVADAAGYSKGAVYSNFRNKDELCLAVLDDIHAEQAARIAEVITGSTTVEERIARIQGWAERNIGDQAWTALEVEFAVNARRDERLRGELASRDKGIRDIIAGLVAANSAEFGIDLPLSADDAATALLSLGIGLGIQRAIDPTIPVSVLTDVMRLVAGRAVSER
ncbi:TetR/AcrR family transcriptional regulator [Haloechinothrix halophila]|uniref:TetR/AcrR family transcriptional regulator n=1 Tax=Haloechinothrix halophila TaxID=1069073 RepID=UPI0005544994|nr:TetR/AcrR family transcriptional regulator [Haloechinothrix halophila]